LRNSVYLVAAFLSLAAAPAAVLAQPPAAGIAAGAAVKDTNGGDVGIVLRVDGQFLVVKTDKHEVRLPAASFTPHNGALLFAMTRDQLNAAVEQQLAAAAASIAPGAAVADAKGAAIGTVSAVDADTVTIKLASGTLVRLPKTGVAPGPRGLVTGATAAELEAAAKAAGPTQ
jgi:preprotein translocase subunit YajC